jgi:hypothetical protein
MAHGRNSGIYQGITGNIWIQTKKWVAHPLFRKRDLAHGQGPDAQIGKDLAYGTRGAEPPSGKRTAGLRGAQVKARVAVR